LTIEDYLFWLHKIVEVLAPFRKRFLLFSAAAVSDFHMKQVAEHKIQSSDGPLTLKLSVVPKVIPILKSKWCPEGMVITFKLETAEEILSKKMNIHLLNYNVDLVIGNILGKHRDQVVLSQKDKPDLWMNRTPEDIQKNIELEMHLVAAVVQRHDLYINS